MSIILVPNISDGSQIDANDVNNMVNPIVNEMNGNLDTYNIADSAITTAKLVDGAVSSDKIASNAIVEAKIQDRAVTMSKFYNPYRFYVYLGSAQNSINGVTPVALNTESFDTNNNFDTSTYTYTPPVNGYYQFNFAVGAGSGASIVWQAILRKNGANAFTGSLINLNATYQQSVGSGLLYLTTSDAIQLNIYANATIAIAASYTTTYLNGFLVSI